jgi:hypothetical protein
METANIKNLKKNLLKPILLLFAIGLLTTSCSKPENGKDGVPGSANVISSAWKTASTTVRDSTVDGTCVRVRHFTAPELSSEILNKGQMITFFRVGLIGPYQLPYFSDAGGATNQVNCIYNLNKIIVYRHTLNTCRFNSGIAATFPGQPVMVNLPLSLEYRYILIPPATATSKISQVNYKSMTYSQVCASLNIPE